MQSRREPYLVIKKDSQLIDHKIKILQQIGEKQRNQVSKLMGRQSTPRTLQQNKQRSINELMDPQSKQNKTQTARKRYRCQDYVEKHDLKVKQVERGERMERVEALQENNYIWNMQKVQNNEQDRQIQYLKSQQYKIYLQKVMKANSKQQKLKLIKQNRNNNVYLGDKKSYIQSIIKSKQVLPRVNLHQFGCAQSQYYDQQKEQRTYVPKHHLNNRIKSSINQEKKVVHMEEKKVIPVQIKKQQLQQSPIKSYPIFQAPTNREKQATQIIPLSPICQTHNKVQTPPLKEQKGSKRQLHYEQEQKATQVQLLQCNSNIQKSSGVSKQEMPSYARSSIKNETYRKQLQYCERQNITDRKQKKKKHTHAYGFKIMEEKANKQNYRCPSSSFSSHQQDRNIYNISFKICHPDQLKKQNHDPSRQYQNKIAKHNQNQPKYQEYKKITPKKRNQQSKQRVQTVYNNLQWSHTTLATKQVENYSNSKSNSKISIVSKSKLKR